jgi:hypothetical protein
MKKLILSALLVILWFAATNAQVVYETFEGGASQQAWSAADGTYNGVVANPAPDATDGSAFCGSYTKKQGASYSLFWVPSLAQPLDISQYHQFKLKVRCDHPTPVLLKFEGVGQSVEKTAVMTKTNQWEELRFDMSAGAFKNGLTKIIIFFDPGVDSSHNTYYFDDLVANKAQLCYETFEGGPQQAWQGLDGVYAGAVANPVLDAVNSSSTCGQYTKSNTAAYSLLLADYVNPIDLSLYNQFKLKVYATAPTSVLLKLEGPNGHSIEKTQNIAVTNAWQEYTFDFSADTFTDLHKFILFFDPGNAASGDTYLFDDLCAGIQGPCKGVASNPDLIDDFECNRNATYWLGYDSLSVIANPHSDVNNPSPRVGRFGDPSGTGTEYAALVIDYENPIDLSVRNQFSLKVWSPKAGNLLLKIEGSPTNPAKEIPVAVTQLNQWVTYKVDFSSQIGKGHRRFTMFFNAGVNGEPGDVYYIDDISLTAPTALPPLEDFEGVALNLGWQPLDGNTNLHGNFTWPSNNSAPNGVNSSAHVACYAKGTSPLSTLQALSGTNFDLSNYPQFNLDVLSPAAGGTVQMQLTSPSVGNKTATATVTTPGAWETLSFDFSAFNAVTDFNEIRLVFNPNTVAAGESWCIDNLNQTKVTINPCAGVQPIPNYIDDFECQRNFTTIYYGASDLSVVNNPYSTTDNSTVKVGKYNHPANSPYAGIGYQFAAPPDLSIRNQLQFQVYSATNNVPFLLKLEGGTSNVEIFDTLKEANKWYSVSTDFSGHIGTDDPKLVIFPNVTSNDAGTFYFDNIHWGRKGYNGCVSDYETPVTSLTNFTYFNNGTYTQPFAVVDNPIKAGINTSNKVGRFVQSGDATIYAGMYDDLDSYIDFKGVKQIKVKVLMDHLGKFTMKAEIFGNTLPAIEVTQSNTKVNEWEELTFDFSAAGDGAKYPRLTIFVDIGSVGTGSNVTTYFDDIVIGAGQCGISGTFSPVVTAMKVSPNPVSDRLHIENLENVQRMEVYNALGQRVASVQTSGDQRTDIDVSRFPSGVYSLAGFTQQGALIGNSKFVVNR